MAGEFGIVEFDSRKLGGHQIITVTCPHRRLLIRAILASGMSFGAEAKYSENVSAGLLKEIAGVLGMNGKAFAKAADLSYKALSQATGKSLANPYSYMQVFDKSSPLSVSLELLLVAESDAESEVYLPAMHLMSLCYPRAISAGKEGGRADFVFNNPGPGLNVAFSEDPPGDYVNVYFGNLETDGDGNPTGKEPAGMFLLSPMEANVSFASECDASGYPLYAKVRFRAQSGDIPFVTEGGSPTFILGRTDAENAVTSAIKAQRDDFEKKEGNA